MSRGSFLTLPPRRYLLIHIPKTAGMSIFKSLKNRDYPVRNLGHPFPSRQLQRGIVSLDEWHKSTKLCVVRHPLDRLVSLYHYMAPRLTYKLRDFAEFVEIVCDPEKRAFTELYNYAEPQVQWLSCGVDHILRFEQLNKEWLQFCDWCNIDYQPLPKENTTPQRREWKHYYTSELEERVRAFYVTDFARFSFPES